MALMGSWIIDWNHLRPKLVSTAPTFGLHLRRIYLYTFYGLSSANTALLFQYHIIRRFDSWLPLRQND